MEFDIRKILVIFAVAFLFSFFSYALFDAFYPEVKWDDYCGERPYVEINSIQECEDAGGKWENNRYAPIKENATGYCDLQYYCSQDYNDAREHRNFYAFLVLAILGGLAILAGIYLPSSNPINEWVGTGFMLGGLFNIFFGTAIYYPDLDRFVRPIILFIELALVIFLTYKKLGVGSDSKPKRRKR